MEPVRNLSYKHFEILSMFSVRHLLAGGYKKKEFLTNFTDFWNAQSVL